MSENPTVNEQELLDILWLRSIRMSENPKVNEQELLDILWLIKEHPEQHDQVTYAHRNQCGTTFCVAGWAVERSKDYQIQWTLNAEGYERGDGTHTGPYWSSHLLDTEGHSETFFQAGKEILGLTEDEAAELFSSSNDIDEIESVIKNIIAGVYRNEECY